MVILNPLFIQYLGTKLMEFLKSPVQFVDFAALLFQEAISLFIIVNNKKGYFYAKCAAIKLQRK